MIKAVMDTNILVCALLSPGVAPARVFDHVLNGHVIMCYDSNTIAEYQAVLKRPKFNFDHTAVVQVIDFILHNGISTVPAPLNIAFSDPDDQVFYEAAKHVQGYLITGNTRHYPPDPIVISANEFLSITEKPTT